jgi:hypothetical protein
VLAVTQPVTVGTNHDKSGYGMNANGLDLVMVETGVNLGKRFRQSWRRRRK